MRGKTFRKDYVLKEMKNELESQISELKKLRDKTGLSRKSFAESLGIPLRTVEDWEAGCRKMPEYLLRLISYKVRIEQLHSDKSISEENKKINVICDAEGKKVVLINDIRFKSRRSIDWNEIENYLKEYIGQYFEIAETSERIYIGTDFPDEFSHSQDTKGLRGANEKAKANISPALSELIQIATNKVEYPDYNNKHKLKAKFGWYRYDTRFGIPVYDDNSELVRYNIFTTRMLVRCDENGQLYLYDFVRTKKETSKPHE